MSPVVRQRLEAFSSLTLRPTFVITTMLLNAALITGMLILWPSTFTYWICLAAAILLLLDLRYLRKLWRNAGRR